MLICENLSKEYGQFAAVKGLGLQVPQGEIFGFLGPNGAGKTTTIRMLMGFLVPSSGRVLIDGLDPQREAVEIRRRVGYLPDYPQFLDNLRGRELLGFVAEMHGLSRFAARDRAAELLESLDLSSAAGEFASNYSAGMKKRLGLACALIHDPLMLILDEPTNGLDPRSARQIRKLIQQQADAGKTILLSTHLLEMAEKLCDRVGIMHHGELVALGSPADLQVSHGPSASLEELFLHLTQTQGVP